jgi:hypothetical protein
MRYTEDTEGRMNTDNTLNEFVEELWDAMCRLRVGSGLSSLEVLQGVEAVWERVELEIKTDRALDSASDR